MAADNPVRVCFLIDRLSRAGTETQMLALIRSLDREKVRPHLVLLDGEDDESRSLEPDDCPVLRLGVRSLCGREMPAAMVRLRRFWRQHRIEVLQTYFLDSTYFGVPFARLCGIRRVVRVRNNLGYWLTSKHRQLGKLVGRLATVTLTNAEGGKQALIESERLAAERVVVLENGVDLDRFPEPKRVWGEGGTVCIGAVANLRPVKNIDGLIQAAAAIVAKFPNVCFDVAGEGEQRAELERLISEHHLESKFRLRGSCSDVPGFLAGLDIAVLNSHSEGMSNALLEYMAAGRALVATDVGANRHLVAPGVEGMIVTPGNEPGLISALGDLIENPQAAQQLGAAARRKVERLYSRSAMVDRFARFYQRLRDDSSFNSVAFAACA